MALTHRCTDGSHVKLERSGPVGTMVGVTFACKRCGIVKDAPRIHADTLAMIPAIVKGLSGK